MHPPWRLHSLFPKPSLSLRSNSFHSSFSLHIFLCQSPFVGFSFTNSGMGKQSKFKKSENFGKGKVTPIQVAFIVDRYLSDNNFAETRSTFRIEASSLISKSPVREAPRTLLSLGAMLNEYVCLKEQKVIMDQEKARLEQEKFRVQSLLQGMQEVMNAYNASGSAPTPMVQASATRPVVVVPRSDPSSGATSGYPVYKSPIVATVSKPTNAVVGNGNFSSPVTRNHPLTRKRVGSNDVLESHPGAKKSRSRLASKKVPTKRADKQLDNLAANQGNVRQTSEVGSLPSNCVPNGSIVQGSSVAKSLFNQLSPSHPTNSSCPKTPQQAIYSQIDKSITPVGVSSNPNCSNSNNSTPQEITPTNCTIITSERVTVSPYKQMTYYTMERNRCISSPAKRLSNRDHVKGRLDFDGSDVMMNLDKLPTTGEASTPESDKDADIFDMDLPNLDTFGADFSFSELLVDLDLDCEGIGFPCQPTLGASMDTVSGSSHESRDANMGVDQVFSEFSSTVTKVISEKEMQVQGPDSLTAVKSITKCIRILSPAKNRKGSLDQDDCLASN